MSNRDRGTAGSLRHGLSKCSASPKLIPEDGSAPSFDIV